MIFSKPKYYTSCSELPLYNFIKLVTTNDLKFLVISGKPKDLNKIWDSIFNEYLELTGESKKSNFLDILKEVTFLSNKVYMIAIAIDSLRVNYNEELANSLKNLGFSVAKNANAEDYQKSLDVATTKLKGIASMLEKRNSELGEFDKKQKTKESDYDGLLSDLSKFQGYRLDPKQIKVSEFISILNSFMKHQKHLQKNGK